MRQLQRFLCALLLCNVLKANSLFAYTDPSISVKFEFSIFVDDNKNVFVFSNFMSTDLRNIFY